MNDALRRSLLAGAVIIIAIVIYVFMEPAPLLPDKGTAPELQGIQGYINVENITIGEYVGKNVVLIDFWTYTCINCQRTLPYLTMWDQKYRVDGLVIIGVHTPEFDFEKKYANVKRAVDKWGIRYPVVLDNDYATWRAYANRFWPHKYLIDINGNIVYDHVGEGGYDETEQRIREELEKRRSMLGEEMKQNLSASARLVPVDFSRIRTPEIYFGSDFIRGNHGQLSQIVPESNVTFSVPDNLSENEVYFDGTWVIHKDHAELVSTSGRILLRYHAKKVNVVASGPSDVDVFIDGKPPRSQHGSAVNEAGKGLVDAEDLYELVDGDYSWHTVEIQMRKGFRMYTFTFG